MSNADGLRLPPALPNIVVTRQQRCFIGRRRGEVSRCVENPAGRHPRPESITMHKEHSMNSYEIEATELLEAL
ncbi:hypothetical protein J2Y62_002653 [Bosea sp. BE168]|jgi:hypothetical protein|nr:hypothetical protein [Bosea sp. BE168]